MGKSEWSKYLKKEKEKIFQATIQGTDGEMDPKGGCSERTVEEIHKSVEYMLSKLKN